MALGDIGGAVTELVITFRTPESGEVNIQKGDAVALVDDYTVDHGGEGGQVFGQAINGASENNTRIPVAIRGVMVFTYTGEAPDADGESGIEAADTPGKVRKPDLGPGFGVVLHVDEANERVHVLL